MQGQLSARHFIGASQVTIEYTSFAIPENELGSDDQLLAFTEPRSIRIEIARSKQKSNANRSILLPRLQTDKGTTGLRHPLDGDMCSDTLATLEKDIVAPNTEVDFDRGIRKAAHAVQQQHPPGVR